MHLGLILALPITSVAVCCSPLNGGASIVNCFLIAVLVPEVLDLAPYEPRRVLFAGSVSSDEGKCQETCYIWHLSDHRALTGGAKSSSHHVVHLSRLNLSTLQVDIMSNNERLKCSVRVLVWGRQHTRY